MSIPVRLIRTCLYLVFFIVPLIFLPNTSELFEFNKMIVVYILTTLIATAWLIQTVLAKKFIFRRTVLDWPILIFLITQTISLLFSVNIRSSLLGYYSRFNGGLVSLYCYSLLYWAYVTFMDKNSAVTTIRVALITAALVAFYGVLEHFGIDAKLWVQDVQNRVFSTMGQPNWLAAYLVALVFIPISRLLNPAPKDRHSDLSRYDPAYFFLDHLSAIWNLFLAFLLLLTILFTKSQSGIGVTLVIFFLYLLFLLIRKRRLKVIAGAGAAFLFLIFINLHIIGNITKNLKFMLTTDVLATAKAADIPNSGGSSSILIRRIVWEGAVHAWLASAKNFFIGTGPETFAMIYYQYRPIAHNYTSEWELLYNKAHNEFINYLATTGILGLGSYLVLLGFMVYVLIKFHHSSSKSNSQEPYLGLGLLAGWLSIPVTNFWGFSVVFVQVLMFTLPAIAQTLTVPPLPASPAGSKLSLPRILSILGLISLGCYLLFVIGQYWIADTLYASGDHDLQLFSMTGNTIYVAPAYQSLTDAFSINSHDPPISSELAVATAFASALTYDTDATSSAQLARSALALSQKAIDDNPLHPNYYKTRARVAIILSTVYKQDLDVAINTLKQALLISPTDPRLPYNLGVIYQQMGRTALAQKYFHQSLQLKPDFADPRVQLAKIASASAKPAK